MKDTVIIFGTDLFAEVAHYYFTHTGNFEVVAFTAHGKFINEEMKCGCPVVAFEKIVEKYPPEKYRMFVAVGYRKLNNVRASIYEEVKSYGYTCVTYIYPEVKIWGNNKIGENTFIFEDNTIQPFAEIGNNTILWSGNHIGHHSIIGNHCFITSHVVISGNCSVGDYTFIGVNATLRDSICVGKSCIIGAGSIIMQDAKDKQLFIADRTRPDKRSTDDIEF